MKVRTSSVGETRQVGVALASVLAPGDVVALSGELGTGKTALAQGVASGLGITDRVVSPTFVIVREYGGPTPLAHVDVYRLSHLQELYDLGFDEVIDDTRVVLVEWADRVTPLLPDDRIDVFLQRGAAEEDREIEIVARGRWLGRNAALSTVLQPFEAD
ncbi:MAG: tRNA (adenosine(37)-N6)-threonylcarbamoyltransferase complex ATPase subunit type 1 TsaE [Actinobacteria bacterium]|nr:tRNA (adenosine(37)-N6)-threonylcarbamoyltransferase complex ATPase subunit type 1 TsaE [Actinomycetota bacterium]